MVKQVFDLLTAVCVQPKQDYDMAGNLCYFEPQLSEHNFSCELRKEKANL